ncbi:MAG: exodeoxyribonuclease VII large subunit [Elusimicrobia bacterium CG_4_9_14_3_um_filter_62_55]|nr:MAG: exodeoxyribonuclease VII large subunit [Elusimicrobia bacterium CG22_combo_CG10-13_8_21_14_all_63_91]PJA16129.1 MAG: exodeoxyribonuclease VII large subunit [Elusimicrobia bacterium CG_4_10_14_0_2_um_filter_63_34]PJB26199.1 MAG: exodeoxyribonuclease VII large subunit [Elusimicrobia bacterium CG_4_9_14_3_um_filter_62_55]
MSGLLEEDGDISGAAAPPALSVAELSRRIHDTLESVFPGQWVEGEISDPRTFPSGHAYFTLKDPEAQISAVLFKGAASGVRFKLEHGLEVLAYGRVSSYVKRGQYQFIVSQMKPKRAGALQLAFEQLKRKLEAEGLFDKGRKRPLPAFPERIGLVTSRQGAALRDMLSVLERRFDGLHIRIFPVPVQGDAAAPAIAEAIADANAYFPDTDVLLVGRGGGSLEDLWAFNEEAVARAIAGSKIPVVSCVGHETDFTIADFVADLRAPTPSAAAELVVSDRAAVLDRLVALAGRLAPALSAAVERLEERLSGLLRSPYLRDPFRLFEAKAQRIDELTGRIAPAFSRLFDRAGERLARAGSRIAPTMRIALERAQTRLGRRMETLDALSPLRVLERGYAIAFKRGTKKLLRSKADAETFDELTIKLQDGEIPVRVE